MKSHRIDLLSLILGLALIALGIAGFAGGLALDGIERSALIPMALLVAAAAIAATVRSTTDPDQRDGRESEGA